MKSAIPGKSDLCGHLQPKCWLLTEQLLQDLWFVPYFWMCCAGYKALAWKEPGHFQLVRSFRNWLPNCLVNKLLKSQALLYKPDSSLRIFFVIMRTIFLCSSGSLQVWICSLIFYSSFCFHLALLRASTAQSSDAPVPTKWSQWSGMSTPSAEAKGLGMEKETTNLITESMCCARSIQTTSGVFLEHPFLTWNAFFSGRHAVTCIF